MVACGADVEGVATGGFEVPDDEDDVRRWFVRFVESDCIDAERCEPEVVVPVLAVWPLPVWVDRPIPNDAPSAPTIPRPASPAWSLLLRWREVMPRRCGGFLCPTCERGGLTVSIT